MPIRKILILGPESTGKSTLAKDLSSHFSEPWASEFSREYLEKMGNSYDFEDLSIIAKGQLKVEDDAAQTAKELLFCDTDLRVIHIWSAHRFGKTSPWILEEIETRVYDLILLTDIDMDWEPDPLREHPEPEMRFYFFKKYLELAKSSGFPFEIISGSAEERLEKAIAVVQTHRKI
jgi:NadR type nicotinamide-nucleotide adenylyltransferase